MNDQDFPIKVGRLEQVRIYRGVTQHSEREYVKYTVSYSLNGKEERKGFAKLAVAKEYAEDRARDLANQDVSLVLKRDAGFVYRRALDALKPCGIPLDLAAMQFAEAYQVLGGLSLVEAAKLSSRLNRGIKQNVTIREVADELLTARQVKGVSAKYLYNLRRALNRFVGVFQETHPRLASLDGPAIQTFLDGLDRRERGGARLPATARTRNNFRATVGLLFEFAKRKKYLPNDHESVERIDKYTEKPKPTEIFTPAEIGTLLTIASSNHPELVPFLAIGAFAGIRHEEIIRLDWKDISLGEGHITVQAGKAKTAARRVVPIAENLARWLAPFQKPFGEVCYRRNMAEPLSRFIEGKAVRNSGFLWKRNALRHSYISYRLAATNDMARVALEAGNSPAMINQHYRQLVTALAAQDWFAVQPPPSGAKIVRLAVA